MKRILVVDDEPAIRSFIRSALEQAGHAVLEAADGPSALDQARAAKPDAILLDVALPALSGLEVCRRLKEDPGTAATPVILLTGLPQPEGPPAQAEGWLIKPFTPAAVAQEVERALHGPQASVRGR